MYEITVRQAVADDSADILQIERACEGLPHWNEEVWAQILRQSSAYDPKLVESGPYGPLRVCFVAEGKDELVGFLVLSFIANMAGGLAEIESLAVMKYARRHGVGRSLCQQAALWSAVRGAESVQLEVRSANIAALGMYGSMGFVEQGRRRRYYADPLDDAVLMTLAIL